MNPHILIVNVRHQIYTTINVLFRLLYYMVAIFKAHKQFVLLLFSIFSWYIGGTLYISLLLFYYIKGIRVNYMLCCTYSTYTRNVLNNSFNGIYLGVPFITYGGYCADSECRTARKLFLFVIILNIYMVSTYIYTSRRSV